MIYEMRENKNHPKLIKQTTKLYLEKHKKFIQVQIVNKLYTWKTNLIIKNHFVGFILKQIEIIIKPKKAH